MENQSKGVSLDEFMFRKLQPVRILVNYLNHELALNDGDTIHMDRAEMDNIISTLEIYIEEYDRVSQHRAARVTASAKKKTQFNDISNKTAIKAIA